MVVLNIDCLQLLLVAKNTVLLVQKKTKCKKLQFYVPNQYFFNSCYCHVGLHIQPKKGLFEGRK
jgi:hypothetical protein